MSDVFISYSRRDKEFVQELVKRLEALGRDVWVDFEDIPFASQWWDEICKGIDGSRAAVFVISPDSLSSEVCGLEINYVLKNNKRLIPIMHREAQDQPIPPSISHINWIHFNNPDTIDESIQKLLETVDTNLETVQKQTRLLTLARDWEKKGHNSSLLLRGEELADFIQLIDNPDLTSIQREFLTRSQIHQRRLDMITRFVWGLVGGLVGIGFWAFSTFRSDVLLTPQRVVYTIALGQSFGLCLGFLSMLADELPQAWQKVWKSKATRLVLRTLLFSGVGIFAWFSYIWCLERMGQTMQDYNALALGGLTLALGFLIRSLVKLPGWVFTLIMTALIWLPIYITYMDNYTRFVPLIYFDSTAQLYAIGIPMALIMALGANMQTMSAEFYKLYHALRSRSASQAAPGALQTVEKV